MSTFNLFAQTHSLQHQRAHPVVDELPVISEESEARVVEGGDGDGDGDGDGNVDWNSEGRDRDETPILIDSLPPTPTLSPTTPEIRIQVEEPVLPPLPLSPRNTGSGMRNGAADDNVDFPVPEFQDDLPPAYTPAPDLNHGEAKFRFNNHPEHLTNPHPHPQISHQRLQRKATPPLPLLLPRGHSHPDRRSPLSIEEDVDLWVSNSSGVGNRRSGADAGLLSTTTTRYACSFGSKTGSIMTGMSERGHRLSLLPPPLPPELAKPMEDRLVPLIVSMLAPTMSGSSNANSSRSLSNVHPIKRQLGFCTQFVHSRNDGLPNLDPPKPKGINPDRLRKWTSSTSNEPSMLKLAK
ncbi:hypothetical protein M378DRAFT_16652 [Amanita muscaria Koide BX008]|uniref:Uncharacterized protein n=1 Tax=Amanita muscaria (strain Koide BX008) TaxID=946122 RepID=A0A0C2WJR2_AMAMK|nr:hypothetical protein M378DRAFT_16652 [Amanita muscaria Koide BX008]